MSVQEFGIRPDPVEAWIDVGGVLAEVHHGDQLAAIADMCVMAELFCRRPEEMYAWWQTVKASSVVPNFENAMNSLEPVVQTLAASDAFWDGSAPRRRPLR